VDVRRHGQALRLEAGKETTKSLSWVTEVIDAKEANGVTAFRVKGWPDRPRSDRFRRLGRAGGEREDRAAVGQQLHVGATAEPSLDGAEGWFSCP